MDRAFTFVVNPVAGRGRAARLLPDLATALATSGLDHRLEVSTRPDDPVELAHRAFDDDRVVVACGGDGTVGLLAGVAADRDGTLAVVPFGAGNDFARMLGYDHRRPLAALEVLRSGNVSTIDLGKVGDRWYCCVAGTGFDAEANRWANTVRRLSGTPLYIAAVLRTLTTYRPRPVRVVTDGAAHEFDAWLVAVANAGSYGGGMRVAPDAILDDGLLDVVVVGPVGRFEFLRTFPKVFRGRHTSHPMVSVIKARSVTVESIAGGATPAPELHVYADGENVGPLPVEITSVPGALRLLAPPSRTSALT